MPRSGAPWPLLLLWTALGGAMLFPTPVVGQGRVLKAVVRDAATSAPLDGAVVRVLGDSGPIQFSGPRGRFSVKVSRIPARVAVARIGFAPDTVELDESVTEIRLQPAPLQLDPLVVAAVRQAPARLDRVIREIDIAMRPRDSSQDLLRLVPGLVIAQHAGGGKAEQIFLRGFDADHGTDVAISVDGTPVNLVSHAHGQGYADLHFLPPEVVAAVEVRKGGHDVRDGNLATAGAVEFRTLDRLDHGRAESRGGSFGTAHVVAAVPLGGKAEQSGGYLFFSGHYSKGPFEAPQDYRRLNGFGKWTTPLGGDRELVVTASAFDSRWDASGQIPARAVRRGLISRFGALDPTEGGTTSRYEAAVGVRAAAWNVRAYAVRYRLDLFSNFTLFLHDSLEGDGIEQRDARILAGLQAGLRSANRVLGKDGTLAAGSSLRIDDIDVVLANQTRRARRDLRVANAITESNASFWARQELSLSPAVQLALGVRGDLFRFVVRERLVLPGMEAEGGVRWRGRLSPRVGVTFSPRAGTSVFGLATRSFHSNDARDVVLAAPGETVLPAATTLEFGLRHVWSAGTVGAAAWRTDLGSELVYVGDEGTTEASGRTRRQGLDLEARIRITPWLWADADLSLVRGRFRDQPEGVNRIPLAPHATLAAGLTARDQGPWEGGARIRHVGARPADEQGQVRALGYTLAELFAGRRWKRLELRLAVDNLFNVEWNEAQFATTSRLRGEPAPVTELHFTPGAPRGITLGVRYGW